VLAALKRNRHGHRGWLIGLIIYRHGLRVFEACDLRWDDIDLLKRTIIVRRLKGSTDSVHYLERDELNGLKLLRRQQQADAIKAAYVFIKSAATRVSQAQAARAADQRGKYVSRNTSAQRRPRFTAKRARLSRLPNTGTGRCIWAFKFSVHWRS
jgi:type 1 fimbriae regulatory protein FimB/type 1 fimbriae regulatory protein FimE